MYDTINIFCCSGCGDLFNIGFDDLSPDVRNSITSAVVDIRTLSADILALTSITADMITLSADMIALSISASKYT